MNFPTPKRLVNSVGLVIVLLANVAAEPATVSSDEQMRFYESRIRPLLVAKCFECHAGENDEGGLRLDAADAITKGGDSGPSVVPGDPESSLLVSAIRYDELEMPPDEPLSKQEQADVIQWIRQGAYWPITNNDPDEPRDDSPQPWWAAEPIEPGVAPELQTNAESPTTIDRYVDRRLEEVGLGRASATDRVRLIRRLSYDLLGVPPSPSEIDRFVSDQRPDAYRRLVDGMFANPAYGERMARLWLDLVRYAESDGWRADAYRPQAWRYREFVTNAFNSGMSYDRFVALQLAGDEIAPGDDEALAAVGFLRLGIYEFNQRDAEGQWQNIVDELTDVTADVFLATGLACAKCHDHKFDPIPRADYFRLRTVFEPVLFVDRKPAAPRQDEARQAKIDALLDQLRAIEGDAIKQLGDGAVDRFPLHVQAMYRKPGKERNSYEHQIAYLVGRQIIDEGLAGNKVEKKIGKERHAKRQEVLQQLRALDADPYAVADLMTVADAAGAIRPTRLPGRTKGRYFEPGVPELFGGQPLEPTRPLDAPQSSGRRTALARWITSPDNPIAARVMVNRLWQYHFGSGLVTSPNDFGRLGRPASHPQLLDYLAAKFIRSGWNIQSIQREIVSSATYQQSSVNTDAPRAMTIDPDNRLLWHKSVRRLDAEQFRDSLLVATDRLEVRVGGPSLSGTPRRRSIYLRRVRNSADEMLATLDAPPGLVGTAKRDVTTTAPQSLMMLNSSRINAVAKQFAARIRDDIEGTPPDQRAPAFVRRGHRIVTGIEADDTTIRLLAPLVATGTDGEVDVCHILLNSNAFLFID